MIIDRVMDFVIAYIISIRYLFKLIVYYFCIGYIWLSLDIGF